MYRNSSRQPGNQGPDGLPDGAIRLVDAQYFSLLGMVDIIGDDGIEHGITQAVEQAVNAKANCKWKQNGKEAR